MKKRLGSFFFLVGIITLVIYIASDITGSPIFSLLILGLLFGFWGGYWMVRGYSPPPPSPRFGLIQRFRHGKMAGTEQKETPKDKK